MKKLLKLLTSENVIAQIFGDDTFLILHNGAWIQLPADCVRDYLRGGDEPPGC